ncbi:hypothetical protein OJHNALOF_00959 [Oceanimonas sp. MB9]|nr:hypothetical protein [Oceanimonas sp. MB9]
MNMTALLMEFSAIVIVLLMAGLPALVRRQLAR